MTNGDGPDWAEQPPPPPGGRPRERLEGLGRVLVPVGLAAVLALLGARTLALVVIAAAVVVAVTIRAWPAAGARIERVFATVGHLAGRGLTVVLLGAVEVLVFLPLSVLARLFRRDLLAPVGGRRAEQGWVDRPVPSEPLTHRPFGPEGGREASRRPVLHGAYLTVRVVGWVVIALVLNYALGWTWDEFFGTHDSPSAEAVPANTVEAFASAPAMADEPWSPAYWEEFRDLEYEFHPFILSRVAPAEGRHIRTAGAERSTYQPAGLDAQDPEVWFLGGAAVWGQGQRDPHTIPSAVARQAERAGRPIRAVNLGQPGYTSWQAALLLEQQLAVRPAPDLVVFYDGAADVAVQLERRSDIPTHHNADGVSEALTGRDSAREQAQDWWQEYRDTSVVSRLLEQVRSVFGAQPAEAQGLGLADQVAVLHARSVELATFVADRQGVDSLFAWQAAEGVRGDGGAYRRLAADDAAAPGVLDLSRTLDDEDGVFLDGVLTDERGAAVVAAALWEAIEDRLR